MNKQNKIETDPDTKDKVVQRGGDWEGWAN